MPTQSRPLRSHLGARLVPVVVCLLAAAATGWAGGGETGVVGRAAALPEPIAEVQDAPAAVDVPDSPPAAPIAVGDGFAAVTLVARESTPRPPQPAMAAYRRAAAVMGLADPSCHLDWSTLAAAGGVSSDHGRVRGGRIDAQRRIRPDLYGTMRRSAPVPDTDAGVLDGTAAADRGAGPLLFWPSSWTSIGVDADGDGFRDPQDLDDSALAAGVLLCGGTRDLGVPTGLVRGLEAFHRGAGFVSAVTRLAAKYAATDSAQPASGPLGFGEVLAVAGSGIVPVDPTSDDASADPDPTLSNETVATPITIPSATSFPTPSGGPTRGPTASPTSSPTGNPTRGPTITPTTAPTVIAPTTPTVGATPTVAASGPASATPSPDPACGSSPAPTATPAPAAACDPDTSPTASPAASPTASPTVSPTASPAPSPESSGP